MAEQQTTNATWAGLPVIRCPFCTFSRVGKYAQTAVDEHVAAAHRKARRRAAIVARVQEAGAALPATAPAVNEAPMNAPAAAPVKE